MIGASAVIAASSAMTCRSSIAEDWSGFRGNDSRGVVADGTIPSQWSDEDYAWRVDLKGRDVGSPAIFGDKVYLLASDPARQMISVRCLQLADGKEVWSKSYPQSKHHLHSRNTFASPTPSVDSESVFVTWADDTHTFLKCFDHSGNETWSRDFGSWQSQHGYGTSPRIFGDLVLLMNSQQGERIPAGEQPGKSRLTAVERGNGATIWETPLETTRSCYGVPAIFRSEDGTAQIINANTGNGMFGLDVTTGKMLWSSKVFRMRVCSTPMIAGDIAIGSSGSGGGGNHLVAVRIPKSGGEAKEVYRIERNAPYVPTPVIVGDNMFLVSDSGIASCIDVNTGEPHWTKRIGGNFGASPVVIGDKLLLISLDGDATVLSATAEYQSLGKTDLGGPVGATPAYSNGHLLIRVGNELRCVKAPAI